MATVFGDLVGTFISISFGCGVNASYANEADWVCTTKNLV